MFNFILLSYVDKGVGTLVAIFFCIRRTTYAETVEYEENDAAHLPMRSMTQGVARFGFPRT